METQERTLRAMGRESVVQYARRLIEVERAYTASTLMPCDSAAAMTARHRLHMAVIDVVAAVEILQAYEAAERVTP